MIGNLDWHASSIAAVLSALAADANGLSDGEASRRLQAFGPNRLHPQTPVSALKVLVDQFRSSARYVLNARVSHRTADARWRRDSFTIDGTTLALSVRVNPLLLLSQCGQSVWLDSISRGLITGGELQRLVQLDGVTGVTSNPTIFAKALTNSSKYDEAINHIIGLHPDISNAALAERLMIEDIQMAADLLRPVFDRTQGADGFVSLEVSPGCAGDTEATIAEARRLWFDVARLNSMIKVPATSAGIAAVEVLIAQGINVNITLMFSLDHYEAVAKAYLHGLSGHQGRHHVSSVASIFVSRLDAVVDPLLEAIGSTESKRLRGRVALANARHIYRRFMAIFHGEPFVDLRRRGARVQRPLWASTGTKDPTYSDVLYLEGLIAPETITTVPPATLDAFRDHGTVQAASLEAAAEADDATLAGAARLGLNLFAITEQLQSDGITAFARSYEQLLEALAQKRQTTAGTAS